MRYVLTVIGATGSSAVDGALTEAASAVLRETGATVGPVDWLDPGLACDLPFDGAPPRVAETALRASLAEAPVDLSVQATGGRRKDLLVADMESTIIAQEMLDELAEVAGVHTEIAEITARTMAGEMDFPAALRQRIDLLTGLPAEALDQVGARITLNPGARTLVQTMRAAGAYTALVSGGFTCFTERVRQACGFDEARGNRLIVDDGRLTGSVAQPVLGPGAKLEALEQLAERHGLPPAAACAVGDGANDLEMVEAAGLGVAYRGKEALRQGARVHVDHGDLTALLFLQGYRRAEFSA